MQDKVVEQMRQQQDFTNPSAKQKPGQKINPGDYIEFEEVK